MTKISTLLSDWAGPKNDEIGSKFLKGRWWVIVNKNPKNPNFIARNTCSHFFLVNIWMLFCIQSVWSVPVFWKQIKLILKCTFLEPIFQTEMSLLNKPNFKKMLSGLIQLSGIYKINIQWCHVLVGDVRPSLSGWYNCLYRRSHINNSVSSQFDGTPPEIVMPSVSDSQATPISPGKLGDLKPIYTFGKKKRQLWLQQKAQRQ